MRAAKYFTIVDTWSCLDERVLTMLEVADTILLCLTLDLPAIKSASRQTSKMIQRRAEDVPWR